VLSSVIKGAGIIELFASAQREWTIQELSRETGMPQPSVHHFVSTFRSIGWLVQDPSTKRYRLGVRMWEIGCTAVNFHEVADAARGYLRALMERCGETVHLGLIARDNPYTVVYVDRVDSSEPVRIVTALGSKVPSHSSAMGKAILAHNPDLEAAVLQGPLDPLTQETIVDADALKADLAATRTRGYSIARGEFMGEMVGIAAPVFERVGGATYGIGLWNSVVRMTPEYVEEVAPLLVATARDVSRQLGYRGRD
jgi:DNA-binding IclR family transcriptional regulator